MEKSFSLEALVAAFDTVLASMIADSVQNDVRPLPSDMHGVTPGQSVDLNEVFRQGRVPIDCVPADVQFNHIDNPADIIGKPTDAFDAARRSGALQSALSEHSGDGSPDVVAPEAPAPETTQE